MYTDEEEVEMQNKCSDDVTALVKDVLAKHDGRLIVAALLAEAAMIAASFRMAKIYSTDHIVGMFSEAQVCALTFESKAKLVFTDGKDSGSRQ